MAHDDKKRAKVAEICLALPPAERSVGHDHVTFRVRGKVLAYHLL